MGKTTYIEVTVNEDNIPQIAAAPIVEKPGKGPKVTLVVNTHRAAIRVAEITKRDKWLTQAAQWRLVEENFPIGPLLNADTHIFDGSLFENADKQCFMMAALPKTIADPIAELGMKEWGSAHNLARLDVIEHVIFRYYVKSTGDVLNEEDEPVKKTMPLWVVFAQDTGYRLLLLDDGLPVSATYLSMHTDTKEMELDMAWGITAPNRVIYATIVFDESEPSCTPCDAWLCEYISNKEIEIESETIYLHSNTR